MFHTDFSFACSLGDCVIPEEAAAEGEETEMRGSVQRMFAKPYQEGHVLIWTHTQEGVADTLLLDG